MANGADIEWNVLNDEIKKLYRTGKYDRSVVVAKKTLEVAEQNVGPDHPDIASILNNLTMLYRRRIRGSAVAHRRWQSRVQLPVPSISPCRDCGRLRGDMNIGIIGVGSIGARHAQAYSKHSKSDVISICDIDEARAKQLTNTHGARAFSSIGNMLSSVIDLRACSICTKGKVAD